MGLNALNKFLTENELNLESPFSRTGVYEQLIDTYVVRVGLPKLKSLIAFLHRQGANFEVLLLSDVLKYFFYLKDLPNALLVIETIYDDASLIPSSSFYFPASYGYEQEIAKKTGIKFEDSFPAEAPVDLAPEFPDTDFETMEIPVGPIHAGVIEPGHFRFTVHGEHIVKLEISLNYLCKNIEAEFKSRSISEGLELAQNICGDSVLAYSLAYIQAIEKIKSLNLTAKTQYTRMILLELERLYNHVGDISGIINDTAFSYAHAHLMTLKERLLRLNKEIFSHRFLKNTINLASVHKDLKEEDLNVLETALAGFLKDFNKIIELTFKHKTVLDRLSKTGHLSNYVAKHLSVTGVVGRASGISFDSRRDLAFSLYEKINFHSHLRREGDVYARFNLRIDEVRESFKIIHQCIENIRVGLLAASTGDNTDTEVGALQELSELRPFAWSMVEAARGPVFVYLELDSENRIKVAKMRDVSKHNWKALEHAVLKNIVPDFPLCNKSFSLAYAGADM